MERREIKIVRAVIKTAVWSAAAAQLVTSFVAEASVGQAMVAIFLLGIAAEITNARFLRSTRVTAVKCAAFVALAAIDGSFTLLIVSAAFDLALKAPVAFAAMPVIAAGVIAPSEVRVVVVLAALLSAVAGWTARRHTTAMRFHTEALDRERGSRYRLEETQRRLESTSRELVRATEHAERTRIAHAIHDDVGHRLSGILMQLQAVQALAATQPERSMHMLDTAVIALRESAAAIRETVYDLRPRSPSGEEEIRRLCTTFRACPVRLAVDEGFDRLDEEVRRLAVAAIRELLTNNARHSHATAASIRLEVDDTRTLTDQADALRLRITYTDNGVGATNVREGMGLGGLRKRIAGRGGTIAYQGQGGFSVHITVPCEEVCDE